MSLFENVPFEEPTREEKLRQVVNRVKRMSAESYKRFAEIQKDGIRVVWNNPEFTAQEILDEVGPDIVKIFTYHGKLTDFIVDLSTGESIAPDILLPTNAFTLSGDRIVVSEEPYTP